MFEVLILVFICLVFICGYCFGKDKRPELDCRLNLRLSWTTEGTVVHVRPVGCKVVVNDERYKGGPKDG